MEALQVTGPRKTPHTVLTCVGWFVYLCMAYTLHRKVKDIKYP